jgi:hypothetical protein
VAAGAVRYVWPAISVPAVFAATLAGAAGAMLALRLVSPRTFRDLMRQLPDVRPVPRAARAQPG